MPPPLRLLILEDQVILRKLISRQTGFFSRQATIIDEFSDPAEALRSVAENSYDLIITDMLGHVDKRMLSTYAIVGDALRRSAVEKISSPTGG